MSLRRRLWLVLGGLFLVPLAVGGLVLLLVVPDARSDRVSDDVDSAAAAVRAELIDECRSLGLAVQVAALSLGSESAPILGDLVRNSAIDYAAVFDGDGTAVAEAGQLPPGVSDPQNLPACTAIASGDAMSPVLAQRQALVGDTTGAGEAVVVKRLDSELMTDLRTRSAADAVVLLNGATSSSPRSTATRRRDSSPPPRTATAWS